MGSGSDPLEGQSGKFEIIEVLTQWNFPEYDSLALTIVPVQTSQKLSQGNLISE